MKSCSIAAFATIWLAASQFAYGQSVHFTSGRYYKDLCPVTSEVGKRRCNAQIITDQIGRPLSLQPRLTNGFYYPSDLRSAYFISGLGGPERVVAVVEAYGYPNANSDMEIYRDFNGLPLCYKNGCFKVFNQRGDQSNYPAYNQSWATETAIDLDMVSAMCPKCRIILVEADSDSSRDLALAAKEAAALGADIISNSYGGPEGGPKYDFPEAYDHPGVVFVASSGDQGYGVQAPAALPTVTAVGGSTLNRNSSGGWTERAWSGSGSGCSAFYHKPDWQTDPLCSKRMVADISAVADPATPVLAFGPATSPTEPSFFGAGGTSVSAPIIAGIYGVAGGPYSPGTMYTVLRPGELRDVVSGSNGQCGEIYFCDAGIGYDGPTGVGVPHGPLALRAPR